MRAALETTTSLPVELRFADLPNAPRGAAGAGDLDARLATARRRYVDADFGGCQEAIADAALIPGLLAAGRRPVAARVQFWRVACHVGAGVGDDAERAAQAFAVFGLETPPDVEATSPEVEAVLAGAQREVAGRKTVPLRITADLGGARVEVDGGARVCVTPCTVDLFPGDHVVAVSDFRTEPAPPELAAEQWTERFAGGTALDSAESLRLLARAVRAPRLILVTVEPTRLRGAFAVDGILAGASERIRRDAGALPGEAPALVRDLLVRGRLLEPATPLYKRTWFWVGVGLTAAAAVAATYVITNPIVDSYARFGEDNK